MVTTVRDFTRRYINLWQFALLAAMLGIFMSVLRPPAQNPAGGVIVTTTVNLRIRTGPGVEYAQLSVVPAGTTLSVLGRNDGTSWVLVEYDGVRGWMAAWFCTFAGDPASVPVSGETGTALAATASEVSGLVITTSANLRIHSGPGTGYPQIGEVWSDTTLSVLDHSADGNWYTVEFDGVRGWIAAWLCRVDSGQFSTAGAPLVSPAPQQAPSAPPTTHAPTLTDYWNGSARWLLDVPDTGLPVGESDTVDMGNGVFWSYLHASTQSAGIHELVRRRR